jgi:hypothetical protein
VPSCASAFKLKFVHPAFPFGLTVIAERGPFDAVRGATTVTFAPVAVQTGDMLAVTVLKANSVCSGPIFTNSPLSQLKFSSNTDPLPATNMVNLQMSRGTQLCARASSNATVIHGYLPVVGSTGGGFGASFKTGVQLSNLGDSIDAPSQGRLVFHPAGRSALDGDPSVNFQLAPGQTVSYDDVVVSAGTSGLGSMDLVMTSGAPPDVTARVFNDAGVNGTAGLSENLQTAGDALRPGNFASLTIPADLTNLRLNIGVRTLDVGVTVSISVYNAAGGKVGGTSRTYGPNYFEQVSVAQFVSPSPVPANGRIELYFNAGSAFLYGAITDNKTNDPALRFFIQN